MDCSGHDHRLFAVPEQGSCLDTTAKPVVVGCFDGDHALGLWCVQRAADGAKLWAFGEYQHLVLADGYSTCDAASPPEPCFATSCAVPFDTVHIQSGCSLKDTAGYLFCGNKTMAFDEACCPRPSCKGPQDCGADQECVQVSSFTFFTAGFFEGGCVWSGTDGGGFYNACVPK